MRYIVGMDAAEHTVDRIVRRIVEAVHPLRVILFGSRARGDARPDSDVDLLVVMPEGTHRRQTAQRLYRDIRGESPSFEVLVATPSDLDKHRDNVGFVYRTILREGKDVY
jgi:predicted nucleotidyltransferase